MEVLSFKQFLRVRVILILILSLISVKAYAQNVADHELKAVFIYNFANFVSWPKDAYQHTHTSFNFCVLGKSQVNTSLAAVIKDETIDGRPAQLIELDESANPLQCQILFFNGSAQKQSTAIFEKIKGKSILTVGDGKKFSQRDGMIYFTHKKRRMHVRINMDSVESEHLKISSKLLRLATLFRSSNQ
ncbi:MAG: YfiR family protein [Gammaproteobacteria bacterium]|nr:YfiR family protein [Gammaproteobacteria bacterium]